MHFQNYISCIVLMFLSHVTGQEYNLTGSLEYASLGMAFTWTCEMFLPSESSNKALGVFFFRNNNQTVLVGMQGVQCIIQTANPRYSYQCLRENVFSLTIPAENMTEFEQKSTWRCEYLFNASYKSPDVILTIAVEVYNVSMIPSDNTLTIREGTQKNVQCVVNSNAVPAPTITWYLGSTDITYMAGTDTTSIIITGDRTDNTKMLQCGATNNNKPPQTAITTLSVEYPPMVNALSNQSKIEGRNLSVNCKATPGNPSSTTFCWTKVDNPGFKQNGATLQLPDIQRTSSGAYICTAENTYKDEEKGNHSQNMNVDVLYPPMVNALSNQSIIEGKDLSVNCTATPGNPSSTTFYWTKVDNTGFKQNGATLQLPDIQRTSSGAYRCTAENSYSNGEKGRHSQFMTVNVQYPPIVNGLSNQTDIIEGRNLLINCTVTPGNPIFTTVYWTKIDKEEFRQDGTTLQLPNLQRTSSGTYICTAKNTYSNGEKGTDNGSMFVNVQYQPVIEKKLRTIVNEGEKVTLSRDIVSNPLSNASWYDGTELLKKQTSTSTANFTFERASCENTKNLSLVASNGIGNTVTALVELIVNCKPKPHRKNITIGVNDTIGIQFSSTVIAYPEPLYELIYENGTKNNQMMDSVIRNAVNNFTYHFKKTVVNQDDYGSYRLVIHNDFGSETIFVNILPQKSPESARNIKVKCEETSAKIQWISSFNGGETQTFTVFVFSGLDKIFISDDIPDKGENKVHDNYVQNLQPSSKYTFYVSAQNRRGNNSSENITCTTSSKVAGDSVPLIAGGAAAGGITLAAIAIVIIVFLRRYRQIDKKAGKNQRLKQEDESENTNDDGLKDNILYISAGPKVEKSETAVYAEVNKKGPESNNNANVYAEVKKGFSKNDVSRKNDAKPKQKKGKKKKSKQEVADVYENSEDIAMASNMDSVYSNTGHKDQDKEERGYKNKDGLLYVEVKFDPTSNKGNPVIHGEDEKTDYATVDFPMPTTPHEVTGDDKI